MHAAASQARARRPIAMPLQEACMNGKHMSRAGNPYLNRQGGQRQGTARGHGQVFFQQWARDARGG